jgi:hypothetical protein
MPDDLETFVGIMWKRSGMPTATEDSGTIEEYRRAIETTEEDLRAGEPLFRREQTKRIRIQLHRQELDLGSDADHY